MQTPDDRPSPEHLFKYLPLDGERLEWARQTLIRKQLWFSLPRAFNDPFDCAPAVEATVSTTNLRQSAIRAANRRTKGRPRFARVKERQAALASIRKNLITTEDARAKAGWTMAMIRDRVAVLSLTEDPESLLMWGHYARSHTGIVLGFETAADRMFATAHPVVYSEDRPIVDLLADRATVMDRTLLRKASDWSYEREWRAIRPDQPGHHTFDKSALAAIIFGAFTSETDEAVVRQAAAIGGLHPTFFRATLDPRRFAMILIDA